MLQHLEEGMVEHGTPAEYHTGADNHAVAKERMMVEQVDML